MLEKEPQDILHTKRLGVAEKNRNPPETQTHRNHAKPTDHV